MTGQARGKRRKKMQQSDEPLIWYWEDAVPEWDEIVAFCKRNGLYSDLDDPKWWQGTSPETYGCGLSTMLDRLPGSGRTTGKRMGCRLWSCDWCGPKMAGERLGETAQTMNVRLTPEYVSQ